MTSVGTTSAPASATYCDDAREWILDLDDLLDAARGSVTRAFTDAEGRQYLHVDACAA
jgi:hypothetical protein